MPSPRARAEFRALVGILIVAGTAVGLARFTEPKAAGEHDTDVPASGTPDPSSAEQAEVAPQFVRVLTGTSIRSPGEPGRLYIAPGSSPASGPGAVLRYAVEVEGGLSIDPRRFAEAVERILGDPRGWTRSGRSFRRVDEGPVHFRVALASPQTTDELCAPLQTNGSLSCQVAGRAVLNLLRWRVPPETYAGDRHAYRIYLVNHEVGHALGYGHVSCPSPGRPAPVMLQQTLNLGGCERNPWPLDSELR
jgi:Protein of unknown function (DUF3152)